MRLVASRGDGSATNYHGPPILAIAVPVVRLLGVAVRDGGGTRPTVTTTKLEQPLWGWALLLSVVVGLALRAWVLNSPLGVIDSDEAAGALIARHLLDGRFNVFLWHNAYGGTLEAFPTAALFAVLGSGALAAKSVVVALYGAACVLTWRVGRRCLGEPAARMGAVLLWLYPGALVLISTKARLYYGSGLVLGLCTLLLCLRLADRAHRRDTALLGLVLGLALWNNVQVGYLAVPAVAWLAVRRPQLWRCVPMAVPSFLVGATPWLAFNIRNDWPLLEQMDPFHTTYLDRLIGFFTQLLPKLLGLRHTYSGAWLLGPVGKVVYAAALAGFVWLLVRRRLPSLLAAVAVAYPFLFAVPRASSYVGEPRYGLVLAPVVALLVALGITKVAGGRPTQLAIAALAAVVSVVGLGAAIDVGRGGAHYDLDPPPLRPLVRALDRRGVTTAYADYWIAYRLSFETRERIVATPVDFVRYLPYDEKVQRSGSGTFLLYRGSPQDRHFADALRRQARPFERVPVTDYAVYTLAQPGADVRGLVK